MLKSSQGYFVYDTEILPITSITIENGQFLLKCELTKVKETLKINTTGRFALLDENFKVVVTRPATGEPNITVVSKGDDLRLQQYLEIVSADLLNDNQKEFVY